MQSAPEDLTAVSLASTVLRAARRLALDLDAELHEQQLGIDHWLVIDAVAATTGGLTMAELQSITLTPGPTLTRVVDKLITRSLAFREVDALDRRKVRVYLSARGVEMHDHLAAGISAVESGWVTTQGPVVRKLIGKG
jgi:DNA-binding MarR family transcriptional regulator